MTKREPLMEQSYFDNEVAYLQNESLPKFKAKIQFSEITPAHRSSISHAIFLRSYQLLITKYSQGETIHNLKLLFPEIVEALEAYHPEDEGEPLRFNFKRHIEEYVVPMWLVSLGIIFEIEDELFEKLVNLIGNEGEDLVYEKLVGTRISGRKQTDKILYPKPYQFLRGAIEAETEHQGKVMTEFLKLWYPSMKQAYWHECHKEKEGGGFFGYWAIEAAGVVKAFKIDDAEFREMPYYPKDLIER